ncbi:MAG: adenine phosphoribosyltransferase [Candidatus Riflebacteria bacterium]|nr:adenine phosphoribosyltransferase [Candidatus Riflebacteria bacterium]
MDLSMRNAIRDVPDFPKKGIIFKDITPLLKHPGHLTRIIDAMYQRYRSKEIAYVAAIEARGYLLAAPLAYRLGAGLIPIRKPGKLPCETLKVTYQLEYGTDSLEMHKDAIEPGKRVLVLDDVLATGGTAEAAVKLVRSAGGNVVEVAFLIELAFLSGRQRLGEVPIHAMLTL